MARRLRAPRIPGSGPSGPRHNAFNKNTRESRQREKLLNGSKANYFRYEMEDLLKQSSTPPEHHNPIIQSLWAKGSRISVKEARIFLHEKAKEGILDADTERRIDQALERYSTWR